jgi:subtilisin-like proprotein convertase family protein
MARDPVARLRALAFAAAFVVPGSARAAAPPFPGITTVLLASTDGELPIPDGGSIVSLIRVEGLSGRVVDVDVTVDLPHTRAADLEVYLVAPSSRTVTLTTDNGSFLDDVFVGTIFDDQASGMPSAPNARNVEYVDLVPAGTLQPEGALGALVGEEPNGLWALVVVDDREGDRGTLRGWSLAISTVPFVPAGAPVDVAGSGGEIPDGDPDGLASSVTVTGLGTALWDVDVLADVRHGRAADLDLFLTAPSGRRIDLATDVGDEAVDLFAGAAFDDQAGTPVSDTMLPTDGTAVGAVVPEGALGAFLGEDPNGTWTLTVADDRGGTAGTLAGWTLRVSAPDCRNGCGEPPPPPPPPAEETLCTECVGADGRVDPTVAGCEPAALQFRSVSILLPRGDGTSARIKLDARLLSSWPTTGSVGLLVADANGALVCATLGDLRTVRGGGLAVRGTAAGGRVGLKVKPDGRVTVRARGVDLGSFDDPTFTVALRLDQQRYIAGVGLRPWGDTLWVFP